MSSINEKRQRNLRLPIARIPNEVLSIIFRDLRNGYIKANKVRLLEIVPRVEGLDGWIGITHVCHAWREVALNTSLLWCYIDISSSWIPELLLAVLRRSKQSRLTVVIGLENILLEKAFWARPRVGAL